MSIIPGAKDNPWKRVPADQRKQYLEFCDRCERKETCREDCAEFRAFYNKILDAADARPFCVVSNDNPIPVLRHIIQITKSENEDPTQFKKWYYSIYSEMEGDKFHFVTGEHRAIEIAQKIKEGETNT